MQGDIFNMFKSFGSMKPTDMMKSLIEQYELNILCRVRDLADARIKELSKSAPAGWSDLDPFSILGVDFNASEEEVRSAYRQKANEAHPDKGGSNEQMAKVNAAFEAIKRFRGWK